MDEVDQVVDLRPVGCYKCGHLLLGDDAEPARHEVSEAPSGKAQVTEYRRHCLRCLACGTLNQADWSEAMPRGSFGPRTQAIVAYLTGRLTACAQAFARRAKAGADYGNAHLITSNPDPCLAEFTFGEIGGDHKYYYQLLIFSFLARWF